MAAPNAGRAFALVVVDELVRHGVTDAVLAPGSRSTPVALALAEHPRVRLHVRIDERSAAFTALGLARVSARPVPLLCTSGTAAAEFHAAVLEADESGVPLLVLTADRPPELRGIGANQTVDQIKLYGGAVRWFCEMGVPESRADAPRYWRSAVSRAVGEALGASARPGPVHLNLALREPLVPVDDGVGFGYDLGGRAGDQPWTLTPTTPRRLPEQVRERIARARSGVVVAGDGVTQDQAAALAAVAQRRRWPIVAEPHSNARRGTAAVVGSDALLRDEAFVRAHRPDVVVACGRIGLSRALLGWLAALQCDLLVVGDDGSWLDPTRSAAIVVAADPAGLGEADGTAADDDEWLADWVGAGVAAADAVDRVLDAADSLTEPRVARDVVAALPSGALLAVASSMPIRDLDLTMRPRDDIRIVANRGVSGIDGFVSTAVGAALAHDRPAWALAGDLSLLHDVNGLLAEPAPDLTIVVINNDGGGIFSVLPQAGGDRGVFERVFGTPHGVDLGAVVAGYGANHVRVDDVRQLHEAVTVTPKGLTVLEVRTDREANAALHRRLTDATAAAVTEWMQR